MVVRTARIYYALILMIGMTIFVIAVAGGKRGGAVDAAFIGSEVADVQFGQGNVLLVRQIRRTMHKPYFGFSAVAAKTDFLVGGDGFFFFAEVRYGDYAANGQRCF